MTIDELAAILKKLGIYGVAAVLLSLVVAIPIIIKIDERYAKEKALQDQTKDTNKKLEEQVKQLQTINGQFQMLLMVMLPKAVAASQVPPSPPILTENEKRMMTNPPPISPEEQAAIDAARPKEVSLQLLQNQTIKANEKLKSIAGSLQPPKSE